QGNAKNTSIGSVIDTGAVSLPTNAPLFVNSTKDNYYLQEGSLAIDSGINSLQERANLASVTSPMGIPPSAIIAPANDLLGQLRVDDFFPQPNGVGQTVFIDRGALERADFLGPKAALAVPLDNDAGGVDHNSTVNKVLLIGQQLTNFSIQFSDAGIGVDDSS